MIGSRRIRGRLVGLAWVVAVSVAAGPGPTEAVPTLPMEVWGSSGFEIDGEAIAVFVDPRGRPCVLDEGGVSCFDDEGEEVWGLDGADLEDVLVSGGRVYLSGPDRLVEVAVGRGARVNLTETAWRDGLVAGDATQAFVIDGQGVSHVGSSEVLATAEDESPVEVLRADNGELGLVDADGWLSWGTPEAGFGEAVELAVARPRRALRTPSGWAILGESEIELLDEDGGSIVVIDGDFNDAVVAEGELWVASSEGVEAVDLRTGVFDETLVAEGATVALAASGERMARVLDGDRRLRVTDGDGLLGGPAHRGGIVGLHPAPGGVITIGAGGGVLRWRGPQDPRWIEEEGVSDAVFDGTGALWLAGEQAVVRRGGAIAVPVVARRLVALGDGVLAGDDRQIWRIDGSGAVVWTAEVPHADGLSVADGVVLATQGAVTLLDVKSGARRRKIVDPDRQIVDAAVAVGGVVLAGTEGLGGPVIGWRPGVKLRAQDSSNAASYAQISPNGRWRVEVSADALVVRSMQSGAVLGRGDRDGVEGWPVAEAGRVWVARDDGRVERWVVEEAVVDAALPAFGAYAQLDDFVPAPAGPPPTWQGAAGADLAGLAVHPDGRAGVIGARWLVLSPTGQAEVVVTDPPLAGVAGLWDPELGLVAVGRDGRVLVRGEDGRVGPVARINGLPTSICAGSAGLVIGAADGLRPLGPGRRALPVGPDEPPIRGIGCGEDGGWLVPEHDRWRRWTSAGGWRWVGHGHPGGGRSVLILPDQMVATGGEDETVVLWDGLSGKPQYVLEGMGGPVVSLATDPEGRRLVAGGSAGAVVWDLATLAPLMRVAPDLDVVSVGLDGDGSGLWVAAKDGTVARFALPALPQTPAER